MSYFPDLEWFLSGVAAHMLTQIKALLEALRAVGAEISLGSCQALSCCLLAFSCCPRLGKVCFDSVRAL